MIKSNKVLTLAEVEEKLEGIKEKEKSEIIEKTLAYVKKFRKLKPEKASKFKDELKQLDIMKLKNKHIAKIIDLIPSDAEDLHNIFIGEDVSLDQNEIEKILSAVSKYR